MTPDRATQDGGPDAPHLGALEGVTFRPVFIMGDHRSGTTLLYQVLDTTRLFTVVRAYHIAERHSLLAHHLDGTQAAARERLTAELRGAGQRNRMIDGVEVSADLPEEYGFLLDGSARPQLNPANLARFVLFCQKMQYVSDSENPILLKNPWDFLNFGYVKEAFPDARFVFVHRNPVHVVNSQIKAIRQLMGEYSPYMALLSEWYTQLHQQPLRLAASRALFSPRLRLGFRIACRHVGRATRYYLKHEDQLPPGDYVNVRYEDLCEDAPGTVSKILDFLGLEDRSGVNYREQIQPRPVSLCPEVERGQASIQRRMQSYNERFGYEAEEANR